MRDVHAEEVARQNRPSRKCDRPISHGQKCGQIVQLGEICPACGVKVLELQDDKGAE